ncbi:hypothetical protein E4U60_007267 [Claviceps pazoutovae]|uniref:Uncharacterized protein n=1 Tax=Claviceps pazoutovae TaxID=1649127 RepID=A0A9P7MKG4_9HYPO|nr:hypothetical protein E4U60_007267 [Claviceps pazoutovae]
MYFPRSLLLLPLITYPAVGAEKSWSKSNLTLELSAYVPPCAEGCFISFLQASIGLRSGQRIPSLQELCSADGKTGFTVGEGAVQCIAAERSIDGCLEQDANSSVIYRAHQMCSGQPGAFTPTHSVITATLVLPPSGGGPVSFPAPSSTHRVSRKPRKSRVSKTTKAFTTTGTELPSTLVVDTHSPPRTTTATSSSSSSSSATALSKADTTLRTSVATETRPAETSTTATSTSTSTPGAAQGASRSLTSFQKAGIAVGVIGFALVAAGSLLFLRLCRNKRKPEKKRLSGKQSGKRDSWGKQLGKEHDGSGGGGGNAGGESAWMADLIYPFRDAPGASSTESTVPLTSAAKPTTAAPLAATLTTAAATAGPSKVMKSPEAGSYSKMTPDSKDITSPGANNRISWHHSVLGLAISPVISPNASPTSKRSSVSRPRSKLLPDKPELSLLLGKKPSTVKTAPADTRYYGNTTPYRGPPEKGMTSPKPTRASPQRSVLPKLVIPQQHDSGEKLPTVGGTKSRKQPRESNMTEFEEDGRRSSSMSSEGHIWRPPSTEPLSAVTPYYVADKHGNWVLADQNTMSQGAARQGRTAPRTPPLSAYLQLATSAANPPVQNRKPMTERKPIHSPPHRVVAGPGISSPAPANSPSPTRQTIRLVTEPEPPLKGRGRDSEQMFVPRPLFSSATAGSTAASGQLPGRRGGLIQPRTPPANSGTTSRTMSSRDDDDDDDANRPVMKRMNLSPVVESPWSAKAHAQTGGRWLVSKPQTQGRETTPAGTRANLVPPPRMPISYTSEGRQTGSRSIYSSTTPRDGQHGDNRATTARTALPTPTPTPTPTTDPDKKPRHGASTTPPIEPIISHMIPTPVISPPSSSLPLSRNLPWPTTHNAATVRTGSPTMRIVRPSPEPEPSTSIQPSTSPSPPRQPQRRPYETRVEEEPWEHGPRPQRQQQRHHQQQEQQQHQQQQQQQQQQERHLHRPVPGWIPGLPAHPRPHPPHPHSHPHPQYGPRPINTNTLWVPPQARTTRGMETEPYHHQLTPRRAQRDAQRSLGGVSVGMQRQDPQGRGLEMKSSSEEELLGYCSTTGTVRGGGEG